MAIEAKHGDGDIKELKVGDTVLVHSSENDKEGKTMTVSSVGDKRVVSEIGDLQLTELHISLKP